MKILKIAVLFCLLIPQMVWAEEPIKVKAIQLSALAFYPEYSAPATAISLNETVVSAELNARIIQFEAKVGDQFKKGAILVRLDCRDYTLVLEQLEAALMGIEARYDFARKSLARAERLRSQHNISEELFEQNQMEWATLNAERSSQEIAIKMAKNNVAKCMVRAPFDAVLVERLSSLGALSMPAMPLVKLVDRSKNGLELSAKVLMQQVVSLQHAAHIEFSSDGEVYAVALRALTPVVEPLQRNRDARFTFVDKQPLPGQAGRLVWKEKEAVIPADYLLARNGLSGVFIIDNGVAKFHVVDGALEGRPLKADLPDDTLLITEGRFALQDGDAVERVQ